MQFNDGVLFLEVDINKLTMKYRNDSKINAAVKVREEVNIKYAVTTFHE